MRLVNEDNLMRRSGTEQYEILVFYETSWILTCSFKHHLMNEIEILFNLALTDLNDTSNLAQTCLMPLAGVFTTV